MTYKTLRVVGCGLLISMMAMAQVSGGSSDNPFVNFLKSLAADAISAAVPLCIIGLLLAGGAWLLGSEHSGARKFAAVMVGMVFVLAISKIITMVQGRV